VTPESKKKVRNIRPRKNRINVNPNLKSPFRTPASIAYDINWDTKSLADKWDWDRYTRLSAFLSHTVYEMGSLIQMKHTQVDWFRQHNYLHRDTVTANLFATLLTLIENHVMHAYTDDILGNPFPKVLEQGSAENSNG
jgi:hypothetical protein